MAAVDPNTRVCPFCGERPGDGMFCAACGRNLANVERMPTAGEPGAEQVQAGKPPLLGRPRRVRGWVVRPVDREDFEKPRRYEPGLFLSVDGRFHRLDSELRGWGQRDFPSYHLVVSPDPVEPPLDER